MEGRESIEATKLDVAVGTRVLSELGIAVGVRASLGHTSRRIPGDPEKFVVKGRGYRVDVLSRMRPEDMVVCDLEGNWLDGPPNSLQCSEVKIHSCILKTRPDVVSVTHAHPDYTVLMSVLGRAIRPMAQEGAGLVLRQINVIPQTKIVVSEAEGMEVATQLGDGDAVLLLGHGAVTVSSRSVEESVMRMAQLEHQARLNYMALCALGPDYPSIPAQLAAAVDSARADLEPHIAERLANLGGPPKAPGPWSYFQENVFADR